MLIAAVACAVLSGVLLFGGSWLVYRADLGYGALYAALGGSIVMAIVGFALVLKVAS